MNVEKDVYKFVIIKVDWLIINYISKNGQFWWWFDVEQYCVQ